MNKFDRMYFIMIVDEIDKQVSVTGILNFDDERELCQKLEGNPIGRFDIRHINFPTKENLTDIINDFIENNPGYSVVPTSVLYNKIFNKPKIDNKNSLFDNQDNSIILEKELYKGGQGSIYFVKGEPNIVAKIYHNDFRFEELLTLNKIYDEDIAKYYAIPQKIIYNSNKNVVGYTMKYYADYNEISALFNISGIKEIIGSIDYRFMVKAAKNFAKAMDILHKKNFIFVDINPRNVLVNKHADIIFVDCDSIKELHYLNFNRLGGDLTPPESINYHCFVQTVDRDLFALAVIIFKILMIGQHPYQGTDAPKEYAKAISSGYYCYGNNAKNKTPIYSELFDALFTDELKALFERAFATNYINKRPSAEEWLNALEHFENTFTTCTKNEKHIYNSNYRKCIWCELEESGFSPFTN